MTSIPIPVGERLYNHRDVKLFVDTASCNFLQPDIAHAGGTSKRDNIANMAEAYDLATAPHCLLGPGRLCFVIALTPSILNTVI